MYISGIRPWLYQSHSQEVYRTLKFRYFKQKCLSRNIQSQADPKVLALREKLLYCDYLDLHKVRMGFKTRQKVYSQEKRFKEKSHFEKLAYEPVYSVMLDNVQQKDNQESLQEEEHDANVDNKKAGPLYMPYARTDSYEIVDDVEFDDTINETSLDEKYLEAKESYSNVRNSLEVEQDEENDTNNALPEGELWKVPPTWMMDYEQYDDTPLYSEWYKNYGTSDPSSRSSSIPCSGCGALLHCKDPAFPGFIPSELFSRKEEEDLKLMICQRCHFLKYYKAALKVNVSIEDYPKLLKIIKKKKCAIILVVDITDFPCSIWPDLKSILHPFTPIFLVGNKIDLLPIDSSSGIFLNHVKQLLTDTVVDITGVSRQNITHVELISAQTKFGVERLINKLQHKWATRGDVYLVGCTNVGKSTLFNTLLNSDYCKAQAIDLIPRATVSPWPGTTLNLLKFPLLYPSSERLQLRIKRLQKEQQPKQEWLEIRKAEFKKTRDIKYATLTDFVGRTFSQRSTTATFDPFGEESHKFMTRKPTLDESKEEYKGSRWCYDTPGTVQRDQILDLLTIDELVLTLPKITMSPRTFDLKPKQTVFVAGLGRLDYLDGEYHMRCTLFSSNRLPITICYTSDADEVYSRLLETEAFVVPTNDPERLKVWPKFESKEFKVTGVYKQSAADVVLSNAGWIAITPYVNENVELRAWTPQGRGIYLRTPALLRRSVLLRGWKAPGTPLYLLGRKAYV
ncbi:nitric oxide-associated protein 1 [Osmia bicornis bicornis]|uniref:nitric oxide-associated protein 1 n=1 Tax=Osmia bicornis bicornis TaxID=1437191 RepID=UPI0010F785FC|nr:nitric oxide-associated protein 1 [Osmia bicornis bicornis]XP_029050957.1 nitric oxide-associated protein 1 [Osmia bicornis bicornis]XP_029050958.1 nitric oxide-associated protein 1 [Osmia bicornis bicornis]XP_029050959.1 nitric oxide-associated protein 1 [Osmia bicornis bicornis]